MILKNKIWNKQIKFFQNKAIKNNDVLKINKLYNLMIFMTILLIAQQIFYQINIKTNDRKFKKNVNSKSINRAELKNCCINFKIYLNLN